MDARAKKAMEVQESRLFPTGKGQSFLEAISTGFHNPAEAMMAGISGRRNGSVKESGARPRSESMRISQDSRPGAGQPHAVYFHTHSR